VGKDNLQGRERYPDLYKSLLEVAFLTAVNAAVGRRITGFGNENLSLAALNGHTQAATLYSTIAKSDHLVKLPSFQLFVALNLQALSLS
jgi:hypothetical protein